MRQNRIDGAFLQRFLTTRRGGDDGTPEWVLMNVRRAANDEQRLWAVEYDVSGMPAATAAEVLARDWHWLKDVLQVTDDPYYARENGKPVVFVWGLPFPDRRFTPEVADRIVDFFQHDPAAGGNYVIGSLPNTYGGLAPAWSAHARRYDGLQVWQSHDYGPDACLCARWGIDYYPHVWPGFSWAHLTGKRVPAAYTSRAGGRFYRERIARALAAGVRPAVRGHVRRVRRGHGHHADERRPAQARPASGAASCATGRIRRTVGCGSRPRRARRWRAHPRRKPSGPPITEHDPATLALRLVGARVRRFGRAECPVTLPDTLPGRWTYFGRGTSRDHRGHRDFTGGLRRHGRGPGGLHPERDGPRARGTEEVQIWGGIRCRDRLNRYAFALRGGSDPELFLARYSPDGNTKFLGFAPLDEAPG